MARRVFYSFHYQPDNWRASQIRNIGVVEGNVPVTDNDWETVKRGGDDAIRRWINTQLDGKSCTVVLIGENTADRKWIKYEIEKSWTEGKGLFGIYIHNLKDSSGNLSRQGNNPFDNFKIGQTKLSAIVKAYNPPYADSRNVYNYVSEKISDWVEEAITIRNQY
mgnify:CR=1 FL=1